VVLASGGYPDSYSVGKKIHGLEELEALPGILPFHAGTRREGDALVTAGGRVLGITAVCTSGGLQTTIAKAYQAVEKLNFEGMHFRHDIGRKGLAQSLSMEEE
jgi:phosphoribosylamine--glycine ligase